jgi:hypothetical protein
MGRTFLKTTAVVAVLGLGLGLAACGDDDDDSGSASADPAAYCDGLVEFNGKVFEIDLDDDASEAEVKEVGAQLAPLLDDMEANAPDAVRDDVEDLNDTAIQPLLDGDGEAFNSDETFEAYGNLVDASSEPCDFQQVGVKALEYQFQGAPTTLKAGTYSLQMSNIGKEDHEMIVVRKADGVTQSIEEIANLPEEQSDSMVEFAGAVMAGPGQSSSTLSTLEPGEYGIVCFLPVGGGEDGAPHFTQGMFAEFTVE